LEETRFESDEKVEQKTVSNKIASKYQASAPELSVSVREEREKEELGPIAFAELALQPRHRPLGLRHTPLGA
jgi:hypothetical protein